jgi:hypothetical protein
MAMEGEYRLLSFKSVFISQYELLSHDAQGHMSWYTMQVICILLLVIHDHLNIYGNGAVRAQCQ